LKKSEDIKDLAVALCKFNSEVSKISKDAQNPQFRSEYVTLDKLIEITRPILQKNGLSIMQTPLAKDTGEIGVQTLLIHETGQYIESEALYMTPVRMIKGGGCEVAKDPQAAGSTISYLRRYSYQAILNLNTGEDDDANSGSGLKNNQEQSQHQVAVTLTEPQIKRLYAIAKKADIDATGVGKLVKSKYKCAVNEMNKKQYDDLCTALEENAEPLKEWLSNQSK
jgi:hypothetical protein